MSYHIGPISTADDYEAATTFITSAKCVRLTGFVSGAPIWYSLLRADAANWSTDKYVASAQTLTFFLSVDRVFSGARFRSAIAGQPATISFDILTPEDIP